MVVVVVVVSVRLARSVRAQPRLGGSIKRRRRVSQQLAASQSSSRRRAEQGSALQTARLQPAAPAMAAGRCWFNVVGMNAACGLCVAWDAAAALPCVCVRVCDCVMLDGTSLWSHSASGWFAEGRGKQARAPRPQRHAQQPAIVTTGGPRARHGPERYFFFASRWFLGSERCAFAGGAIVFQGYCVAKRQAGQCVRVAMTGLGGAVGDGVPISIASAAQPGHAHQDSSNGLHDSLQRALGPDLGLQPTIVLSGLCRKPPPSPKNYPPAPPFSLCPGSSRRTTFVAATLPPTAYRLPPTTTTTTTTTTPQ